MGSSTNWHYERKAQLVAYKGGICADCKGVFPQCCYDFDHKDPLNKSFNIGEAASRGTSMSDLMIEADKCDLVCANCHRIRTAGNPKIAQKMRLGLIGKEPWNKGKKAPYSEEVLAKMSKSQKQRFKRDGGTRKGDHLTIEQKEHLSKTLKERKIKPSKEAQSLGGKATQKLYRDRKIAGKN